jgi:hypothetical protein
MATVRASELEFAAAHGAAPLPASLDGARGVRLEASVPDILVQETRALVGRRRPTIESLPVDAGIEPNGLDLTHSF